MNGNELRETVKHLRNDGSGATRIKEELRSSGVDISLSSVKRMLKEIDTELATEKSRSPVHTASRYYKNGMYREQYFRSKSAILWLLLYHPFILAVIILSVSANVFSVDLVLRGTITFGWLPGLLLPMDLMIYLFIRFKFNPL